MPSKRTTSSSHSLDTVATVGRGTSVIVDSVFKNLCDQLLSADPGYSRLKSAARAAVAALCTAFLLYHLHGFLKGSISLIIPGVFVAAMTGLLANDGEAEARRHTYFGAMICSFIAMCLGAVLWPYDFESACAFTLIVAIAVASRPFGPRAMTIGMVSFISYFQAMFLKPTIADAATFGFAIGVGGVVSYLVRELLVPDVPKLMFRTSLSSFFAQGRIVLADLEKLAAAKATAQTRLRALVESDLLKLNDLALTIDDGIKNIKLTDRDTALVTSETYGDAKIALLRERLFLAEQAIAIGARSALEMSDPRAIAKDSIKARADFAAASRELLACAGSLRNAEYSTQAPGLAPKQEPWVAFHLAVQAAASCWFAIYAGRAISTSRWYWAVIAAFVVFARVTTLGATVKRATERIIGTMIAVGILVVLIESSEHLGVQMQSHQQIAAACLFLCLFASYYFLRTSYTLMVFFITLMLAFLYELLGRLTADVLILRLELTLVGSLVALIVASVLMPLRTRRSLKRASKKATPIFYGAVEHLSLDETRRLDHALAIARTAAASSFHRTCEYARGILQMSLFSHLALMGLLNDESRKKVLEKSGAADIDKNDLISILRTDNRAALTRVSVDAIDLLVAPEPGFNLTTT